MSVNSKMTALADKIRALSGTEEAMGLDDMKTNLSEANDEVDSQADLITQIQTALQNKASGGSDGGSVKTCTVIINSIASSNSPEPPIIGGVYTTVVANGRIELFQNSSIMSTSTQIDNVVCGSILIANILGYTQIKCEGGNLINALRTTYICAISIGYDDTVTITLL